MRTLQSRPYVVKTIHLARRRTLAKKIHRSAGAGTGNAADTGVTLYLAAARQTAAVVIFRPISIVPAWTDGILANFTIKKWVLPMKNNSSRLCLSAVQNSYRQSRTRIFLFRRIKRSETPVWLRANPDRRELMLRREARAAADVGVICEAHRTPPASTRDHYAILKRRRALPFVISSRFRRYVQTLMKPTPCDIQP